MLNNLIACTNKCKNGLGYISELTKNVGPVANSHTATVNTDFISLKVFVDRSIE